jgi:hypothetical protein
VGAIPPLYFAFETVLCVPPPLPFAQLEMSLVTAQPVLPVSVAIDTAPAVSALSEKMMVTSARTSPASPVGVTVNATGPAAFTSGLAAVPRVPPLCFAPYTNGSACRVRLPCMMWPISAQAL